MPIRSASRQQRCIALMGLLRGALGAALAAAAMWFDRRSLRAIVQRAERWSEALIFLAAIDRTLLTRQRGGRRAAFAPPGFRRLKTSAGFALRLSRLRGARLGLLQRLRRLRDVLADPHALIARVALRLGRAAAQVRLAAVAPAPLRLTACAPAFAPAGADSS